MAWHVDGEVVSHAEFMVEALRRSPGGPLVGVRRTLQFGDLPPYGPERVHPPELLREVARQFDAAMVLELARTG